MALSREAYLRLIGLPVPTSSSKAIELLQNMIKASIGPYLDRQVVEVSGTVETQDLQLEAKFIAVQEVD